jgi:hypothetical protein
MRIRSPAAFRDRLRRLGHANQAALAIVIFLSGALLSVKVVASPPVRTFVVRITRETPE